MVPVIDAIAAGIASQSKEKALQLEGLAEIPWSGTGKPDRLFGSVRLADL
jgi:hypothetical protein